MSRKTKVAPPRLWHSARDCRELHGEGTDRVGSTIQVDRQGRLRSFSRPRQATHGSGSEGGRAVHARRASRQAVPSQQARQAPGTGMDSFRPGGRPEAARQASHPRREDFTSHERRWLGEGGGFQVSSHRSPSLSD